MTYDPTFSAPRREAGLIERLSASLIGVPLGIALIFFPISLLWWNEHRDVEAQRVVEAAMVQVLSVAAGPVAPANEGRLIHVVGPTSASGVTDTALDVALPGLIVAQRRIEMYQWIERTPANDAPGAQPGYDKVWSGRWLDSRNFRVAQGHVNPPMPAAPALLIADDARLGAFRLGPATLSALSPAGFQTVRPGAAPAGFVRDPVSGGLFRGRDASAPAVGDVRVVYSGVPAGRTVSVVARQSGDGFTDQPMGRGSTLLLAAVGERSAQSLLDEKADHEAVLTWFVRILGVVVMAAGFMLLFGPFATLVGAVPWIGALAVGLTFDVAVALAATLAGVTIGVAWLVVHPWTSITLIAVALLGGGAYLLYRS